jgi:putative DNA primase/helicase
VCNIEFLIATIPARQRGRATNTTVTWEWLRNRLGNPVHDNLYTFEQYEKLSADVRGHAKDVGSFVGGPFSEGKRKRENLIERTVVTLDLDELTPEQFERIKSGKTGLHKYEHVVHTTRSHSPEAPRLRMVFPMTRAVTPEEYAPLARIVGSKLFDTTAESMDAVADESFRVAQVMYWPSVSKGQEFYTDHNEAGLLDPGEVLAAFGNWHDWTLLPFSEKRGQKRPSSNKKAENPREKRGAIGAFCRAYTVVQAIEKFLSDVYELGDTGGSKQRYTYTQGQGSNGAVIEDDGLFLYSHHGTDPCSERLVNAFDLVRIHLFGAEDEKAKDDTDPTKLPSYKAMIEFAKADPLVTREMAKTQYDFAAMFDDVEDTGEEAFTSAERKRPIDNEEDILGAGGDWRDELEIDSFGKFASTAWNVTLIVQNDPRLAGCVEYNGFREQVVTRQRLRSKTPQIAAPHIIDRTNGDSWQDKHDDAVRTLIEAPRGDSRPGWGMKVTDRDLKTGVNNAARLRAFHPVRDYLNSLSWDGTPRVYAFWIDYVGAPDNAYIRETAWCFFLGAVARAFEQGHKFDYVPILQGAQGLRKSTLVRILAKDWFGELKGDFDNQTRLIEQMQGRWLMEIPELAGFNKSEVEAVKAFVTEEDNQVRLAYGRRAQVFKRQCVFIGSTNAEEYLQDIENRRWWPIPVLQMIDTERLEANVDQLWAEATAIYRGLRREQPEGNLPLFLRDTEAVSIAKGNQEEVRTQQESDIMAGRIEMWLDTPLTAFDDQEDSDLLGGGGEMVTLRNMTCVAEVWHDWLGNLAAPNRHHQNQVVAALRQLGWKRAPRDKDGKDKKGNRPTFGRHGQQRAFLRPSGRTATE